MRRFNLRAVVAYLLLSAPALASADIPPPSGYKETCTVELARSAGETCERCGTYFRERDKCDRTLGKAGYARRCKTRGASVWSEVWCKAEIPVDGGASPEVDGGPLPPPVVPPEAPPPPPSPAVPFIQPPSSDVDGGAERGPVNDGGVATRLEPPATWPTARGSLAIAWAEPARHDDGTSAGDVSRAPTARAGASVEGMTLGQGGLLAFLLVATAWGWARGRARVRATRR